MILRNAYNDPKAAEWLSERIHAPVVTLPFSVGGTPGAKDLFGLFDDTITRLLASIEMSDFTFDLSILWPALIAGCLVVLSHVPLGQQVLSARHRVHRPRDRAGRRARRDRGARVRSRARGMAHAGGRGDRGAARRAAAHVDRAQAAGGAGSADRHPVRARIDRADPAAGQQLRTAARALKDLLAGQILWVSSDQLIRAAGADARCSCVVWFRWRERIGRIGFYVLFALMVTMSVQLVGVYLVFTTLIVPAVATYRHASGASNCALGLRARRRELCCLDSARRS